MSSLQPCPHCGGDAFLIRRYSYHHRCYFVYVKCDICGAQGKTVTSHKEPEHDYDERKAWEYANGLWDSRDSACNYAIMAWNMRVTNKPTVNPDEKIFVERS